MEVTEVEDVHGTDVPPVLLTFPFSQRALVSALSDDGHFSSRSLQSSMMIASSLWASFGRR